MDRQNLGIFGETLAADYFKRQGFMILERNFHLQHGEVDLIVKKGKKLVFVEVKTRASYQFGLPIEAITRRKQTSLLHSINYYLSRGNFDDYSWQIDLVAITVDHRGKAVRFEHIENIVVDN